MIFFAMICVARGGEFEG